MIVQNQRFISETVKWLEMMAIQVDLDVETSELGKNAMMFKCAVISGYKQKMVLFSKVCIRIFRQKC